MVVGIIVIFSVMVIILYIWLFIVVVYNIVTAIIKKNAHKACMDILLLFAFILASYYLASYVLDYLSGMLG